MKNQIWPGFIKPEKDELFSSWLMRLAFEHRIKTYSFSKIYFENMPIWNRDIDKSQSKVLRKKVLEHTPLSIQKVNSMFLDSYLGYAFDQFNMNALSPGIIKIGIYHRKRTMKSILYCSKCLSEPIPYYRKSWRLISSIACVRCCELLQDCCPHCKSHIAFHRLESGIKDDILKYELHQCWNCKQDLRENNLPIKKKSDEYRYQKYIDKSLQLGYNDHTNYSFTYMKILQLIAQRMSSRSKLWDRIRLASEKEFKLQPNQNLSFNNLSDRRLLLLNSFRILENWPRKFNKFITSHNIRYSDFSKGETMPYWFYKAFK